MNKDKRESLGYGFVHYESAESAEQAINRVDGKVIMGEKVSVQAFKSRKDRTGGNNKFKFTNIFIKNLPADITSEQLEALFKPYGTVTSSVINVDKETKNRSFGFINYAAPEEATAAVEAMNNNEYEGRKLYVSRAQKRDEREKELRERFESLKAERAKKYAGVNLYVKNLNDDMDDSKMTVEFSKYGQITSCKVMRDAAGKSRGFGFVCYSTPEEATKAVTELNGRMIDGKPLYVALAQRKDVRRQQLEAQYAARAKMAGGAMGGIGMTAAGPAAGFPSQAAMQALYGQPNPMMSFPPSLPPQARQFMYNQQGMIGPMTNMVMGPQFPRFPQQPLMGQQGQNGVVAQNQPGQQRGPQQGVLNPQQMNYPLMPSLANVGPAGQQRGLPLQQTPGMNNVNPVTAAQQGLLPQQQQRGPQTANVGQQQQRGPRGGPQGQQQGGPQQQRANGQQVQQNGLNAAALNKNLPPHLLAAQQQQQVANQQNIRYTDNARNRGAAGTTTVNPSQQGAPNMNGISSNASNNNNNSADTAIVMPLLNEPLTVKALANAPEEMRKQMIGERLFPAIKQQEPQLAGKITGMLLEMDNGELIHLLESQSALNEKISEALQVLHQHPEMVELSQQEQQQQQDTDKQ